MDTSQTVEAPPSRPASSLRVLVLADVDTNATALIERVLEPAGINAYTDPEKGGRPSALVVDVTQLRGDPLAGLRNVRSQGIDAPAIVLAAHFPPAQLRGLFRLGTRDIMLKPYKPADLCQAILDLFETHYTEGQTNRLARRLEGMREDIRRRSEEIRLLSDIGRAVASLDNLDQILTRLVEAAAYVTDAEEASIYLVDTKSNSLILRASKQAGERHATLQKLRVEDTLVGQVYQTGQPILRQPSLESGPLKVQTGFLVKSLINVPLRSHRKTVGVLGVYNRLAMRNFDEHHLTLLVALADWAGVALERASLVRQTQPRLREPSLPPSPEVSEGIGKALSTLEPFLNGAFGQLSDIQHQELESIREQLNQLRNIRPVAVDPSLKAKLVDLPGIVQSIADQVKPIVSRRGLELAAETNSTLPLFEGDRKRISQVVEALTAAAVRRTKQGRVLLQVHRFEILNGFSREMPVPPELQLPDGPWAAVTIADTSRGLSPDTIRALSTPTIDPSAGNLGPGLSMGEIRMIVESLRGALWYEQTPASTTVAFAIPAA